MEMSVYKYSPLTIGYDCLKATSEKRWTYELNNNNNNNNTVTRSEDTNGRSAVVEIALEWQFGRSRIVVVTIV